MMVWLIPANFSMVSAFMITYLLEIITKKTV